MRTIAAWLFPRSRGVGAAGRAGAQAWARSLFPLPADPSPWPRPVVVGGYVAALVVLCLVALVRQVGVAATQTIWAEDAVIFYRYALAHAFWWDLHKAYNGYGQLFPRLAVEVARLAPQRDAAEVIAVCGALSLAALGCLVSHMARGHIASPLLRALLVASMVLLPAATTELLDNLVNVPWWLFFAAFWALLWRPRTLVGKVLAGLVCLLAVGSDPLVGLLAVLVMSRVWWPSVTPASTPRPWGSRLAWCSRPS